MASIWPLYHTGLISGLLQRWLLFWKVLLSPQRNAGALSEWPSGSWSPPWLRPFSPWLLSLARTAWRVLVVLNFSIYEWCSLGPSIQHHFFLYPSPDLCLDTILSRRSTDNSLDFMSWFVLWNALLQVDTNKVVETSQGWSVETGCTWTQFWVSWQRLWILMYMGFFSLSLFFLINLQRFQINLFQIVIMGYCLWNFMKNNELNPF